MIESFDVLDSLMAEFVEEPFTVTVPCTQHKLACVFHRVLAPYVDEQNREHVVILCHGYLANKNSVFLPQLSREMSDSVNNRFHSVRFDFHGCGESTGREDWDYGGYENETRNDLRSVVEYIRNSNEKYFVRGLIGHSRAGTTVLLYATYFDDIPIIVNVAGRFRLDRGIIERFSQEQLEQLKNNGSFLIKTMKDGDFQITSEGIDRRKNIDLRQIEKVRHAKVLNIWGDQDTVIPNDDIYMYHNHLQGTKETKMIIVPDADHCFTDTENILIRLIQPWINQSID